VVSGKPLDDALRRAQLALKARAEFADPYYWAAFQLTRSELNPL
jgi:CHAT domain-containing protein